MGPCYVVFKGKKPKIYMSWYECSEQVLGLKNAIYKKYNNYEHALRDFNAYVGAATLSPKLFLVDCCESIPRPSG
jgi:viroplasmin and RNaseH domain-containing protein